MKKFIIALIGVLLITASAFGQTAEKQLTHFGFGFSLNLFDNKMPDNIAQNVKFEFTPIFTIASAPEIYLVGDVNYATQGLAGLGGGILMKVKDFTWGKLVVGGSFAPIEFTTNTPDTTRDIQMNGTGTASFDVSLVLNEWNGFRPAIRIRREANVAMKDEFVKEKYNNLTIVSAGIIF